MIMLKFSSMTAKDGCIITPKMAEKIVENIDIVLISGDIFRYYEVIDCFEIRSKTISYPVFIKDNMFCIMPNTGIPI